MTNESDSFIQEVDESLRQDRMLAMGKRYGPYLIGVFVLIVAAVAGWQFWEAQQRNAARTQSEAFMAASQLIEQGDLAGAKAAFSDLSDQGPRNYRLMARMEHAALLQAEGDLQGAVEEFDQVAEQAEDSIMRDSAHMRAAYLVADTQDFDAVQTRLRPLIDGGGRISYLAQELLGVEAWEAGELDLARETLENLQLAFDAPETVRRRAQLALTVIGPAPEAASDAAPAQTPAEGETE
ncbi:MAG: tetratricopeptide repeat protein [Hyphomonadaceae bacterium]